MRIWPLLVLLVGSPALAEDDDEPPRRSRSYHALTIRLADRDVDNVSTSFEGTALALGRRFGAYTLYADAELGYQHHETLAGLATGAALHARRRICGFTTLDNNDELSIPCWVDLGIGWSTLFTRDATLSRPVLSLGIGGGAEVASRRQRGGLGFGFAIELSPVTNAARRLAPQAERTTEPTATSNRVDAGLRFEMTFVF